MQPGFYGLWYDRPAAAWTEALPVGNGRFGGMVYGGIQHETIALNEDTVWDGMRLDRTNPDAWPSLAEIRAAIFDRDYEQALDIAKGMLGVPMTLDSYQPLCSVDIRLDHTGIFCDYKRGIDLENALHRVEYRLKGVGSEYGRSYRREAFASAPDQVLAMRWETDLERGMNLDIRLSRFAPVQVEASDASCLLTGRCREGGVGFAALLRVRVDSGQVFSEADILKVRGASGLEIRIAGATDYAGGDAAASCHAIVDAAEPLTYVQLRERHITDYQRLYGRQRFSLGGDPSRATTHSMIQGFRSNHPDRTLYELFYNYLRYLLICSSRPGTQPSNLQGIWNDNMKAPWNSDYHPNVNMQINYWAAEGFGLPECVEPLADWLQKVAASGARTAQVHYRARGWVLHHISDIFGCTTPMDGPWGLWPFGGSWLCRHLYEHYRYTGDKAFLRDKALPLIEGAVLFMLDFLIECPQGLEGEGCLITCPSHSPENRFLDAGGKPSWLTYASTMDMELIYDLFTIYLDTLQILDLASPLAEQAEQARSRLVPIRISKRTGCIQEWIEDYAEAEPGHRHVSQLFALYPGDQITSGQPELFAACEATLERRLANDYDGQGWSYGWLAGLFARLGKGSRSLAMIDQIIRNLTLDNLMIDAHGNPQVGDAQSIAAAIQEMLAQSHTDVIELLPALPDEWPDGSMEGLCIRGGLSLDLFWAGGELTHVALAARENRTITIRTTLMALLDSDGNCLAWRDDQEGTLRVEVNAGQTYTLAKIN